ncbi:MAG TPA: hypothetical protein VF578_21950 [Methylomirabilota bacterium]
MILDLDDFIAGCPAAVGDPVHARRVYALANVRCRRETEAEP